MSEDPRTYWTPLLFPWRPEHVGCLTPEQLLATVEIAEMRLTRGSVW